MEALQDINESIADTMLTWVQHFIAQRKSALSKGKKGIASGELLRSFELEIDRLAREEGIALLIAFDEAGRFLDMQPQSFSHDVWGRNALSRLEGWVKERGIGNFLPGYIKRYPGTGFRKGLNLAAIISRIAWGIAVKRGRGNFRRGKDWWNKSKTAGTYELINQVAATLPKPTIEALTNQFRKQ